MAGSSLTDEGWGDVGDIRASPCDSTLFSPRLGSPHKVKTVTYEWERWVCSFSCGQSTWQKQLREKGFPFYRLTVSDFSLWRQGSYGVREWGCWWHPHSRKKTSKGQLLTTLWSASSSLSFKALSSKQCHLLGTKCPNTWAYGGHFPFKLQESPYDFQGSKPIGWDASAVQMKRRPVSSALSTEPRHCWSFHFCLFSGEGKHTGRW